MRPLGVPSIRSPRGTAWGGGPEDGRGRKGTRMENVNSIKIISYNVRGLNSPGKRNIILRELEKSKAEIIFLQETHITQNSNAKIYSRNIPTWYQGDSPIRRAKGVAIGIGKNVRFLIDQRKIDPEGRYLFITGTIHGVKYTLANVYCPNKNPKKYLIDIIN